MALSNCKECGKEVSSEAAACPHCGHPVKPQAQKSANVFGIVLKVVIALIIIGIAIFVLFCAGAGFVANKAIQNTHNNLDIARIENTKLQMVQLKSGLLLFEHDNGFYPETQQGLDALIAMPTTGREPSRYDYNGYILSDEIPTDQWGNSFIYYGPDKPGVHSFEIISKGPDGLPKTEDDISSRNIKSK